MRAKKTRFFCQPFSKSAQKRLFWLFFQKFACSAEIFAKIGSKQCFGTAQKINLVDLKKRSSKFFENPRSPRENPSPPLVKEIPKLRLVNKLIFPRLQEYEFYVWIFCDRQFCSSLRLCHKFHIFLYFSCFRIFSSSQNKPRTEPKI